MSDTPLDYGALLTRWKLQCEDNERLERELAEARKETVWAEQVALTHQDLRAKAEAENAALGEALRSLMAACPADPDTTPKFLSAWREAQDILERRP